MSKDNLASNKAKERSQPQTAESSTEVIPNLYRGRPDKQKQLDRSIELEDQSPGSVGSREQRPKPKPPLPVLPSATNATGEVFNPGDLILVSAPWGGTAQAEIVSFYQDDNGCAWAKYTPKASMPNWTWEGGTVRALLLKKA